MPSRINPITNRFVLFTLVTAALFSPPAAPAQQTGEAVQVEQIRRHAILAEPVRGLGIANPDSVTIRWQSEIAVRALHAFAREGQRVEAGNPLVTIDPTPLQRAEALAKICLEGTSRLKQLAENLAAKADMPVVQRSEGEDHRFAASISLGDLLFGGPEYSYQRRRETVTIHSRAEAEERKVRAEDIIIASTTEATACEHRLEDALAGLAHISLSARHGGIVHNVSVQAGDLIGRGTALVTVGDEASVEVVAYLDVRDYQRTPYGSRCSFELQSGPGPVPCVLTRRQSLPLGDTAVVWQVAARLLEAPPVGVFQDMLGEISIYPNGPPVLALPVEALVRKPNGALGAWVVLEDSTVAYRGVSLGGETDDRYVQILGGIEPSEYVVRGPATLARLNTGDRVDPHPWLPEGASPDDRPTLRNIAIALRMEQWLDDRGELLPISQLPGVSATDGTVVEIDLRGHDLTGWLPPQLGALSGLRRLDLGQNRLTGGIPPLLSELAHLKTLLLDGNPGMSGPLPGSMKALRLDSLILQDTDLCVPSRDAVLKAWEWSVGESDAPICEPSTDRGPTYSILLESDGPKPHPSHGVWVSYRALLLDGTPIDSSPGQRIHLTPDGTTDVSELLLVPGVREAVLSVGLGGKIRVMIPPELARLGMGEPGVSVDPNGGLVYEIELLEIMSPACAGGRGRHRHHVDQPRITSICPGRE